MTEEERVLKLKDIEEEREKEKENRRVLQNVVLNFSMIRPTEMKYT